MILIWQPEALCCWTCIYWLKKPQTLWTRFFITFNMSELSFNRRTLVYLFKRTFLLAWQMFSANAICTNITEDWYHRNNIKGFVFPEIAKGIEHICKGNKNWIWFDYLCLVKVTRNLAAADQIFAGSGFSRVSPPCPRPSVTVLCPMLSFPLSESGPSEAQWVITLLMFY